MGALVRDGSGRIVVVRRGHAPAAGLWSIPGGRVEGGESLTDAVRREVLEETGLAVSVGEVAGCIELMADDTEAADGCHHPDESVCYVVTDFYATPADPAAQLIAAGDDAVDARWVTQVELAALDTSPGLTDTLTEWGVWWAANGAAWTLGDQSGL
ncbi:MAG: NUDIX domain-containing protein [Nocardioidaceae bacterium]|nr:NUDIX domain-containing protein [Nocardioidaceae bacterium]